MANDAHLLLALVQQPEGVVQPLLQKAGVNVTRLTDEVEREISRFPKQEGQAAEPTFSREIQRVFDRAEQDARKIGDAYVSTEHLLLALAEEKGTAARTRADRPGRLGGRAPPRAGGGARLPPGDRPGARRRSTRRWSATPGTSPTWPAVESSTP